MPEDSPRESRLLNTCLAGVMYEGRHIAARTLTLADQIRVRRDPGNSEDTNAIIVETQDGRELGFIRRELAAFLAPHMDKSEETPHVRLTELSSDACESAYRVGVCLTVPENWFGEMSRSADVNPQCIEYCYDDSGLNPYVLLNCTDERLAEIRREMEAEGIQCVRHGLCYRPASNGHPYQWYIRVERALEQGRTRVEDFFRRKFGIVPERDLAHDLEETKRELEEQALAKERQLEEYLEKAREYETQIGRLGAQHQRERRELERKIERVRGEVDALKSDLGRVDDENRQLRYQMRRRAHSRIQVLPEGTSDDVPDSVADVLRDIVGESLTPKQSLFVVGGLFPKRVGVLQTAVKSAAGADGFLYRKLLFELLWKLATEYWYTVARGGSDEEARKTFGDHYAARESETVEKNRRARSSRTFDYAGRKILMLKHLRIGTTQGPFETIRVHFEWLHDESKVIIGYCGKHLPQK